LLPKKLFWPSNFAKNLVSMQHIIRIIFLSFLLGSLNLVKGQDTVQLSKATMLEKLASRNRQIKTAEQDYKASRADYRQSNALFLPQLTLSYTAMSTNNPLMAFGSKLNQEIVSQQDFNPQLLNNPDRIDNFATEIEVLQPLINVDGVLERQAARAKMEAMQLSASRTKEAMALEASKSFTMLQLSYEALGVMQQAEETALENLRITQNYFEQGLIQKADLLAVQLRVNEVSIQREATENQLYTLSNHLAFLIGDTLSNQLYQPEEALDTSIEQLSFPMEVPMERSDIRAMQQVVNAYGKLAESSKTSFLPRLNAFGKYQLYDDELLQADANGYLIGAQLQWQLFKGYQNVGKAEKAKINYEKAQLEAEAYYAQSQVELQKQQRALLLSYNKVKSKQLALKQAKEAYKIRKDRFAQGLEKTADLLMAETMLTQKELEYLQSIFEYQLSQEYMAFLTR
jgi:outer membrane protein TolC